MSAIAAVNNSADLFGLSGSLGVGTVSILGGDATNSTPNAAAVLASGSTPDPNDPTVTLSAALAANAQNTATTDALSTGKLTNVQHNVISAIGGTSNNSYSINWDANGTEPTVLAQLRKYGWIKLLKPDFKASDNSVTAATYALTTIGKAIYKRTGGGPATTTDGAIDLTT